MNPKTTTTRHIIIKMSKVKAKERLIKAARKKKIHVMHIGRKLRINKFPFGNSTSEKIVELHL